MLWKDLEHLICRVDSRRGSGGEPEHFLGSVNILLAAHSLVFLLGPCFLGLNCCCACYLQFEPLSFQKKFCRCWSAGPVGGGFGLEQGHVGPDPLQGRIGSVPEGYFYPLLSHSLRNTQILQPIIENVEVQGKYSRTQLWGREVQAAV